MDEKLQKKKRPDLTKVRAALERLELGKLNQVDQEEWDRWEAYQQVQEGATCH